MARTTTKEPELFGDSQKADQDKPKADSVKRKTDSVKPKVDTDKKTGQAVAIQQAPAPALPSLYQTILAIARDPSIPLDRMEAVVNLAERMEAREAERAFTTAFNALQFELPTIDRDGKIDHGEGRTSRGHEKLRTSYSTYPNLMRVCRPLLKKYGFTFNNIVEPSANLDRIVVVGYLTHVAGHGMVSRFPMSIDAGPGRSNAQGWGSASSYGKRYNLILMLDIVSEDPRDQDNDGYARKSSGRKGADDDGIEQLARITQKQLEELRETLEWAQVSDSNFCNRYGIDKVKDLPADMFDKAKADLKSYRAEKDARGG